MNNSDLPANPYPPSPGKLEDKPGYPGNTAHRVERGNSMPDKGRLNQGHGHVWPRSDGVRARCGGPHLCNDCARDFVQRYGSKVVGTTASYDLPIKTTDEATNALSDQAQLGQTAKPFTPETGQNSARRLIDRLAPDEPVFCLVGRDISGAMFVRSWIALQELNPNPPWAEIRRARQILAQFEQYHRDGKTHWPD